MSFGISSIAPLSGGKPYSDTARLRSAASVGFTAPAASDAAQPAAASPAFRFSDVARDTSAMAALRASQPNLGDYAYDGQSSGTAASFADIVGAAYSSAPIVAPGRFVDVYA